MKASGCFHILKMGAGNNFAAIKEHANPAVSRHVHYLSDYDDDYLPAFVLHNLHAGSLRVIRNGHIAFYL